MGDLSPHFDRKEFACRCKCGFDTVDAKLIECLEGIRQHFGAAMTINSGCRCMKRNTAEKGSPKSQHLCGKAADIVVAGVSADQVADYLEKNYPNCYGIGRYLGRTHIDVRPVRARWDFRKNLSRVAP